VYLRQYFVARDFRRRGIGGQAIPVLAEEVWPALEFWRAVGFVDYLITLEMELSG